MIPAILDTHHAIVGSSGGGKTVTAKAEVEQLLRQQRHLAVIDPTDVWYGLRSNAAGDAKGFDIPVFGGLHGDVPIGPHDGAAVASIVIEQNVSAIVSLGLIHDGADQRRFMAGFVKRLRHKPKGNFHLIVDEADEACPQTTVDDVSFQLTQDMVWIAKRGRAAGFVLTVVTQRPADISKAVLSQMQTIVAHQLVDPRDQKAIDDYLKAKGDKPVRDQVMESLPALEVGERWIYSPRLALLERGRTPPIATFDSSRTPAAGERHVEPKMLGQLDVSALRAALIEAGALSAIAPGAWPGNGSLVPSEVEGRITDLQNEVRDLRAKLMIERGKHERYKTAIAEAIKTLHLFAPTSTHHDGSDEKAETNRSGDEKKSTPPATEATIAPVRRARGQGVTGDAPGGAGGSAISPAEPVTPATEGKPRGFKALIPLARIAPAAVSEAQWASLAGYAKTGGTWGTYKGQLRAAGLVEQDGALWRATEAGCAAAGVEGGELPGLGPDLVRFWADRIPGVRRMAEVLLKRWPHFTTRDALAADLGMAAGGGTFGTYLGRLRSNGLLEEQGKRVRLNHELMAEA